MSEWIPFCLDDGETKHLFKTREEWEGWLAGQAGEKLADPQHKAWRERLWTTTFCDYPTERGFEPPRFGLRTSKYHHTPSLAEWAKKRGIVL